MKRSVTKNLGITVYVSYLVAYVIPLIVLSLVMFYVERAEKIRHFLPSDTTDIDVVTALSIDKTVDSWQKSLETALKSNNSGAFARFLEINKEYETLVFDLSAAATQPEWIKSLQTSDKNRQEIVEKIKKIDELTTELAAVTEKAVLPQADKILTQFSDIYNALIIKERDAAEALSQIILRFQDGVLKTTQYIVTGNDATATVARQTFLSIEDGITQIDTSTSRVAQEKLADVRVKLSAFYTEVDVIGKQQEERKELLAALSAPEMLDAINQVNPLLTTPWHDALSKIDGRKFDKIFSTVRYLLIIGFLLLGVGLLYALIHAYIHFQKPIETLISYTSHAYITRKRMPVPGMERKDELGALARAIHGMLERMQSNQLLAAPSGENAETIIVEQEPQDVQAPLAIITPQYIASLNKAYRKTEEFSEVAQKIFDYASTASERASEGADLADQTRKFVTEASNIMQELLRQVEGMSTAIETKATLAADLDLFSARNEVRTRNMQMAVFRLGETLRALASLSDEVTILSQNAKIAEYHRDHSKETINKMIEDICRLSKHFSEAGVVVERDITMMHKMTQESVQAADTLSASIRQNVMLAGSLLSKGRECRDYVHEHYSQVQNAAFQAGRLAILMLDISGEIIQSSNNSIKVRSIAAEALETLEDMRKILTERPTKPALPSAS
jgi:methyl-accepting chemotaxis protein